MKIANLDYVEVLASNEIVGGTGRRGNNFDFSKRLNIKIYEDVYAKKYLDTYSRVYGNSAVAEADAEAYGRDSNAEGFSFTYTDSNSSKAGATSISQSN
jgi:hypothetical protein